MLIFDLMKNRIAEIRMARGLTLQEIAERAGTTNQQISHLEKGRRKLSYEWMERLAAVFACHPLELLASPPATGDTHKMVLSSRERELLDLFRSLGAEEQDTLLAVVQPMVLLVKRSSHR